MNGPRLVPVTIVLALASLAIAIVSAGFSTHDPHWWPAALHLAVLGGLAPMIYSVNFRIVPVFARRNWAKPRLLFLQIACALPGAVLVYVGILLEIAWFERAGSALALAAGVLFTINLALLFRQPPSGAPALPLPFPEQELVDRIATRFSRMSGGFLLFGLSVGVMSTFWTPDRGRWELVWAHAMLLGFVVSMASAVTYHVLPRWATGRWRSVVLIRLHFVVTAVAVPAMLVALATDSGTLLKVAGPLQAVALAMWIITIVPLAIPLPQPTRDAVLAAFGFLSIGIALGATFALDPYYGSIYRQIHAEFNIFGWSGMLVLGVAYYLLPRFFGKPIRWPKLAIAQMTMLAGGIFVAAILLRLRVSGRGDFEYAIWAAHWIAACGIASFAVQAIATFRSRPGTIMTLLPRRPAVPQAR